MPGIDFDKLRADITMEQVLKQLGFEPISTRTFRSWRSIHDTRKRASKRSEWILGIFEPRPS